MSQTFIVSKTPTGLRLKQHGVVLSEILRRPGPTHSVFDVLAASAHSLNPGSPLVLLGFAGGSMMAPLRRLSQNTVVAAVDIDPAGHALFRDQAGAWVGDLRWRQADAIAWLKYQRHRWKVIIDDLSIVADRAVVKPEACFTILPSLMRDRLLPDGVVIANLLRPPGLSWADALAPYTRLFPTVYEIQLDEFENRILVAGRTLPNARRFGGLLRRTLRSLRSHQAGRLHLRTLPRAEPIPSRPTPPGR